MTKLNGFKEAIITNKEVRCPVCGRKHFELTGDELVRNLKIFCKGNKQTKNNTHFFVLNIGGK